MFLCVEVGSGMDQGKGRVRAGRAGRAGRARGGGVS